MVGVGGMSGALKHMGFSACLTSLYRGRVAECFTGFGNLLRCGGRSNVTAGGYCGRASPLSFSPLLKTSAGWTLTRAANVQKNPPPLGLNRPGICHLPKVAQ